MSKDIVESDLKTLLKKAGGDYVATYEGIIAEEKAKAVARAPRSTVESRKLAWKDAVAKLDRGLIAKINKTLSGYIRLVKANAEVTSAETPRILDEAEAQSLMQEYLDLKTIEEFVKSRYEQIRRAAFGSMTESLAADGEEFPEHINAIIEIEELGQKFCREGTGRKDPELDEDLLKELLGDKRWKAVSVEEVIPAQTYTHLDMDKLMELARKEPAVLELIRDALEVGDWKTPRLSVREIKKG